MDPAVEHAARLVAAAWNDPGPVPLNHVRAKRRLRRDWPVLARAVEALAAAVADQPPTE